MSLEVLLHVALEPSENSWTVRGKEEDLELLNFVTVTFVISCLLKSLELGFLNSLSLPNRKRSRASCSWRDGPTRPIIFARVRVWGFCEVPKISPYVRSATSVPYPRSERPVWELWAHRQKLWDLWDLCSLDVSWAFSLTCSISCGVEDEYCLLTPENKRHSNWSEAVGHVEKWVLLDFVALKDR